MRTTETLNASTSELGACIIYFNLSENISFDKNRNCVFQATVTSFEGTVASESLLSYSTLALHAIESRRIQEIEESNKNPNNEIQCLSFDGNVYTISLTNGDNGNFVNEPSSGNGISLENS